MFQKTVLSAAAANNVVGGNIQGKDVIDFKHGPYGMCYQLKGYEGQWLRNEKHKGGGYKRCDEK